MIKQTKTAPKLGQKCAKFLQKSLKLAYWSYFFTIQTLKFTDHSHDGVLLTVAKENLKHFNHYGDTACFEPLLKYFLHSWVFQFKLKLLLFKNRIKIICKENQFPMVPMQVISFQNTDDLKISF